MSRLTQECCYFRVSKVSNDRHRSFVPRNKSIPDSDGRDGRVHDGREEGLPWPGDEEERRTRWESWHRVTNLSLTLRPSFSYGASQPRSRLPLFVDALRAVVVLGPVPFVNVTTLTSSVFPLQLQAKAGLPLAHRGLGRLSHRCLEWTGSVV